MNGGKESKRLLRDLDTWRNKDSILYTAPSNSISLANIKMLEFKVSAFVCITTLLLKKIPCVMKPDCTID